MSVILGIDVGSLSVKLSGVAEKSLWPVIDELVSSNKGYNWTNYQLDGNKRVFVVDTVRVAGKPAIVTQNLINKIKEDMPEGSVKSITLTGSGGKFVATKLGLKYTTDFKSIAEVFKNYYKKY
jgi:activator of 2-hydroxyglutaryl-CoA dehydratase